MKTVSRLNVVWVVLITLHHLWLWHLGAPLRYTRIDQLVDDGLWIIAAVCVATVVSYISDFKKETT